MAVKMASEKWRQWLEVILLASAHLGAAKAYIKHEVIKALDMASAPQLPNQLPVCSRHLRSKFIQWCHSCRLTCHPEWHEPSVCFSSGSGLWTLPSCPLEPLRHFGTLTSFSQTESPPQILSSHSHAPEEETQTSLHLSQPVRPDNLFVT